MYLLRGRGHPKSTNQAISTHLSLFLLDFRALICCEYPRRRTFYGKKNTKDNGNKRLAPGWHENLCFFDPNKNRIVNIHTKKGLETFDPVDLDDFLIQTTGHWNIATPEQKEELL